MLKLSINKGRLCLLPVSLIDHAITAPPGQSGARILEEMDIAYSDGLARDMAPLYERVKSVIPSVEWPFFAPYIKAINELKKKRKMPSFWRIITKRRKFFTALPMSLATACNWLSKRPKRRAI